MKYTSNKKAFTLVELLVIICIVMILLGLLAPLVTAVYYSTYKELNYQQNVYIQNGFYKGQSGKIIEKKSVMNYRVQLDSGVIVEINRGYIK